LKEKVLWIIPREGGNAMSILKDQKGDAKIFF